MIDETTDEKAKADVEEEAASKKAAEVKIVKDAADKKKAEVDAELAEAEPALIEAKQAVAGLDPKAIGELKGMNNPPAGCNDVTKAIQILLGEFKKHEWAQGQQMMKDPNKFKEKLEKYPKENITPKMLEMLDTIVKQDFFNYENMK